MGDASATPAQLKTLAAGGDGWKRPSEQAADKSSIASMDHGSWARDRRAAGWSDAQIAAGIADYQSIRTSWVEEQKKAGRSEQDISDAFGQFDLSTVNPDAAKQFPANPMVASLREATDKWLAKNKAEGAAGDKKYNDELIAKTTDGADAAALDQRRYLQSRLRRMSGIDSTFMTGPRGSAPKKGIL
jgi:hypothetical protein